jgi:hypothetical protein
MGMLDDSETLQMPDTRPKKQEAVRSFGELEEYHPLQVHVRSRITASAAALHVCDACQCHVTSADRPGTRVTSDSL